MDKNPFSLYDFLGYVIPGLIALAIFSVFYKFHYCEIYDIYSVKNFVSIQILLIDKFSLDNILIIIIASYFFGHVFAFISSISIEKYALWHYKYPSVYLFGDEPPKSDYFGNYETKKEKEGKRIDWRIFVLKSWKIILWIILFPITVVR